jgi:alkanesulfonate monooxygenase SsuD/methylene tetrahydromethanopterin reductase-like flavin-dependent oxidoreductase (luciferase family)
VATDIQTKMKLGILQFFSWPGRRQLVQTVYARALERIAIMDGAGYDAVWLTEHHFNDYSVTGFKWSSQHNV